MYLLNSGDPDVIFGMYSFKKKAGNCAYSKEEKLDVPYGG